MSLQNTTGSRQPALEQSEENKTNTSPSYGACGLRMPGFEEQMVTTSEVKPWHHHRGVGHNDSLCSRRVGEVLNDSQTNTDRDEWGWE